MSWYNTANFYHIYPLGLTDAPQTNTYTSNIHRLKDLNQWILHIKELNFNALYIGPLFESGTHGYDTTDYKKLDSRLGTNKDLTEFVYTCHKNGIKVIFDGVFNHVGRDFFAFKDLKENRENSKYTDWFCNVNFSGNNEYNDGFSYENWGGYNLLVKLNQKNEEVINYITDVIKFWTEEFDVDGIRLDAADVLDFDFMKRIRKTTDGLKKDFWLMGEVIHGDYTKWVNDQTLHSVTNYQLHKALYSGHNDQNYFEIAHTVKRLCQSFKEFTLYNFVDNHDVERIYTKLKNKNHFVPVHILLYTLPGIPSVYYGSEFGIEGKKEKNNDYSLRPFIDLKNFKDNSYAKFLALLGKIRNKHKEFIYGDYKELLLTNKQYVFSRDDIIIAVNNDDKDFIAEIPAVCDTYKASLLNEKVFARNGKIKINIPACGGEIWVPGKKAGTNKKTDTDTVTEILIPPVTDEDEKRLYPELTYSPQINYEEMTVEELQMGILEKMAKNGPVTEQMKKDVYENTHHQSLITWIKSFG